MSGSCTAQDIAGSWRGLDGPLREVDQKGFVGLGDGCFLVCDLSGEQTPSSLLLVLGKVISQVPRAWYAFPTLDLALCN